ncbi:hypothetical protein AZZ82_004816 [Klebsiella aerogenes]|nr:hypothetical protein AZZ82_004816 [Klebsiella aerogenes]
MSDTADSTLNALAGRPFGCTATAVCGPPFITGCATLLPTQKRGAVRADRGTAPA